MVDIPATDANKDLAKSVNSRIASDARMTAAKAGLWTMGGCALLAIGIGAGVALALWGYARIHDVSTASQTIATALATALKDSKLTLDDKATVRLDAAASVRMDPKDNIVAFDPNTRVGVSGTVDLNTRGAVVGIDPNTKVGVSGVVTLDPNARITVNGGGGAASIPRPTTEQLGPTERYQGRTVHTNFTVFKEIKYNQGSVVTGYNYIGDETTPKAQFCYYTTDMVEGASVRINLAANNVFIPSKNAAKLNAKEAASNCVWFDGNPTRFW